MIKPYHYLCQQFQRKGFFVSVLLWFFNFVDIVLYQRELG